MKEYLTFNRLVNLMVIHFFHNEWDSQTPDYMWEKYNRIFSSLPDKLSCKDGRLIYPKGISRFEIAHFEQNIEQYKIKWHYKKLKSEDLIMIFTLYHIVNGYLNPRYLNTRYRHLFSSYGCINDDLQITGLHELLREAIWSIVDEKYEEFIPYQRTSQIIKIKKLLK